LKYIKFSRFCKKEKKRDSLLYGGYEFVNKKTPRTLILREVFKFEILMQIWLYIIARHAPRRESTGKP
jgi:hypothetical protein